MKSHRILVVDDDLSTLRLVKDKLELAGFYVLTASAGHQALDLIAHHGLPHLAIVDIVMPGMDGFEFCRTVQQYADLPVIMLTAIDEEETIIEGIEHYAEDYITKPFSPRELAARVERVLRRIGDFAYALEPVTRIDRRLAVDFAHQQAIVSDKTMAHPQRRPDGLDGFPAETVVAQGRSVRRYFARAHSPLATKDRA
jgi:DNA-binding response OmpR family regulator